MQTCSLNGCENTFELENAYSFVPWVALTAAPDKPSFQCDSQHMGCSQEHARIAAIACLDEHLIPKLNGGSPDMAYKVGQAPTE